MPSLKELRNRIASVKATQKITKAMQMVAAAKLRRAQTAAEAARPYATRMEAVLANLATALKGREGGPPLMVGTGKDARSSADRLHRRARPVRRVQFVHRPARPRARQSAAGRRQAGEDPLRRQEGLRPIEAALRAAHHRGHRVSGASASFPSSMPRRSPTRCWPCSPRAPSTWPRCSSPASAR